MINDQDYKNLLENNLKILDIKGVSLSNILKNKINLKSHNNINKLFQFSQANNKKLKQEKNDEALF